MVSFVNQYIYRSSHRRCSIKKSVLRNFSKFTGKHLYQSLFFNNVTEHLWWLLLHLVCLIQSILWKEFFCSQYSNNFLKNISVLISISVYSWIICRDFLISLANILSVVLFFMLRDSLLYKRMFPQKSFVDNNLQKQSPRSVLWERCS